MRNLLSSAAFWLLLTVSFILPSAPLPAASPAFQDNTTSTGQIAYIGLDRNIYVYSTEDQRSTAVTDDATSNRRYLYPTWSTDGRLAFFCCDPAAQQPVLEAYVLHTPDATPRMIYQADGEGFTYANWSPVDNCISGPACRQLGVLIAQTTEAGFKVELIEDSPENTETSLHTSIGTGAPFYFSWNPDGSQMVWHRNNDQIDVYHVEKQSIVDSLKISAGGFAAPMWSPVNDQILIANGSPDASTLNLITLQQFRPTVLAEDPALFTAFNWSPDGQMIAYRTLQSDVYSGVNVIDAASGESINRTRDHAIAFFWSPDSTKIAYISLIELSQSQSAARDFNRHVSQLNQQGSGYALAWTVFSIADGSIEYFDPFIPTSEMVYILSYFDQFAQSHRLWSPDSRYLVYSEVIEQSSAQVTILDTEDPSALPFAVAEGTLGIWSY